jgi:hypothetical protein
MTKPNKPEIIQLLELMTLLLRLCISETKCDWTQLSGEQLRTLQRELVLTMRAASDVAAELYTHIRLAKD